MHHVLRVVTFVLWAAVTLGALGTAIPSLADVSAPPGASHPFAQLMFKIIHRTEKIEEIIIRTVYCKPPYEPSKGPTRADLEIEQLLVEELSAEFNQAAATFQRASSERMGLAFVGGYPVIDGIRLDATNAVSARDYWAKARGYVTRMQSVLKRKIDALNAAPERDCAPPKRTQTEPPKPPVDWLAGLTRPVPDKIDFVPLRPFFCSEREKYEWIRANIFPDHQQAADNVRDATDYRVDVGRKMRELEAKENLETIEPAEVYGLALLRAEYAWATANIAAMEAVEKSFSTHYMNAQNIPVIDCGPKDKVYALPSGGQTRPPAYEPVPPITVPDRFCSEAEKKKAIDALRKAADTAARNYIKANARVSELASLMTGGKYSNSLRDAFFEASREAEAHGKTLAEANAALRKAEAMPVVDCRQSGVMPGAAAGAKAGTPTGVAAGAQAGAEAGAPSGAAAGGSAGAQTGAREIGMGTAGGAGLGANAAAAFGTQHLPTFVYLGFENAALVQTFAVENLDDDEQFTAFDGEITLGVEPLVRYDSPSVAGFLVIGFNTFEVDGSTFRSEIDPLGQDLLLPFTTTPGISLGSGVAEGTPGGFNVVTDFQYRYNADQFSLYAKYGQRWACEEGALTGYAGLAYTNLGQDQFARGDVTGFASEFRYNTRIEVDTWRAVAGLRYERELFHTPLGGLRGFVDVMGSVNFVDGEGRDAVDVSGFLNFAEVQDIAKSDTTFGYGLGAGLVQHIDETAMDIYIAYRHFGDETTPVVVRQDDGPSHLTFERSDYDMIIVGARVQF